MKRCFKILWLIITIVFYWNNSWAQISEGGVPQSFGDLSVEPLDNIQKVVL